jgi:NADPH-dependent ferric siderophore reductase
MRTDTPVYTAEVVDRTMVTPHMLRITLGGVRAEGGRRFESSGRPDEFFGLWLPGPDGDEVKRYYSVRAWREDRDELDIDFVVHAHGAATSWAREAVPGDRVAFDRPRGHYDPPPACDRVVLVGDATALPAIARILDERTVDDPAVTVIVSVDDPRDRQRLLLHEGDAIRWVAADELLEATIVAAAGDEDHAYVWFSGEATTMREVRRHLRHTRGWATSRYMTMGYWRRDEELWAAEFARRPELDARIAAIWESSEDGEVQRDRVDALLTRHGL